jgi:hypothetical protein
MFFTLLALLVASCLVPQSAFQGAIRALSPPPMSRRDALARLDENRAARENVTRRLLEVIEEQKIVHDSNPEEWARLEAEFNALIEEDDILRLQMTRLVNAATMWPRSPPARRTGTAFRKLLRDISSG